jgi:ribonuclease HI
MIISDIVIHTDGGARGNPGPAAIGAVLESNGEIIQQISECIGKTTNNQAEYQAVHAALVAALQYGAKRVEVFCDSELVVKQIRGEYKVKNKELGPWYIKIHGLMQRIGSVTFTAIAREENELADALVNRALDAQARNT